MRLLTYASVTLVFALTLFLVIWLIPLPALAQDGGTAVTIPWGDWLVVVLANSGEIVLSIVGLAVSWLLLRLPGPIADFIKTLRVEQFLERAIEYGISATKGAAKGRSLSVDVGSGVIAEALRYVIDKAPGALITWMGGPDAIREMILARLDLDTDADGETALYTARLIENANPAPGAPRK